MWQLVATPALWLLGALHALVSDWGPALALLAALIGVSGMAVKQRRKPHQRRSAAMAAVDVEVKRLHAAHFGDRQRLQREIFDLYRRHDVNPLGGCSTALFEWLPFATMGISVYAALRVDPILAHSAFLWLPARRP